jgi:hypothetical protein
VLASTITPNADEALIALCDLFVQNEAQQASLYATIRDDDERDVALEPLCSGKPLSTRSNRSKGRPRLRALRPWRARRSPPLRWNGTGT